MQPEYVGVEVYYGTGTYELLQETQGYTVIFAKQYLLILIVN